MPGTLEGGRRAAETNKRLQGKNFYRDIGSIGGSKSHPNKGFGSNRKLARQVGAIGGSRSTRLSRTRIQILKAQIIKLHHRKFYTADIATALGVSVSTVRTYKLELGLE